jgi:cytoskeletal protein CcmA (bactofilin family)
MAYTTESGVKVVPIGCLLNDPPKMVHRSTVTGTINGNSAASEFFADVAKVEGEVVSSGTVKIGAGSVIIGNISAASAVIAGAIKGDIDVQGPVVVDTSAVVMGNIKSRSVQINNGAVIEGFCSQCYADIDVQGLFDGK